MSENYQNSITDQICKVQTSKKLIALYDRLRYTSYNSYAQLHAKGVWIYSIPSFVNANSHQERKNYMNNTTTEL